MELNLGKAGSAGSDTGIKLLSPERLCKAAATGPCVVAAAMRLLQLPEPDIATGNSLESTSEDGGRLRAVFPLSEDTTAWETAKAIRCIVSSGILALVGNGLPCKVMLDAVDTEDAAVTIESGCGGVDLRRDDVRRVAVG